jgi:hypothetical protein
MHQLFDAEFAARVELHHGCGYRRTFDDTTFGRRLSHNFSVLYFKSAHDTKFVSVTEQPEAQVNEKTKGWGEL